MNFIYFGVECTGSTNLVTPLSLIQVSSCQGALSCLWTTGRVGSCHQCSSCLGLFI